MTYLLENFEGMVEHVISLGNRQAARRFDKFLQAAEQEFRREQLDRIHNYLHPKDAVSEAEIRFREEWVCVDRSRTAIISGDEIEISVDDENITLALDDIDAWDIPENEQSEGYRITQKILDRIVSSRKRLQMQYYLRPSGYLGKFLEMIHRAASCSDGYGLEKILQPKEPIYIGAAYRREKNRRIGAAVSAVVIFTCISSYFSLDAMLNGGIKKQSIEEKNRISKKYVGLPTGSRIGFSGEPGGRSTGQRGTQAVAPGWNGNSKYSQAIGEIINSFKIDFPGNANVPGLPEPLEDEAIHRYLALTENPGIQNTKYKIVEHDDDPVPLDLAFITEKEGILLDRPELVKKDKRIIHIIIDVTSSRKSSGIMSDPPDPDFGKVIAYQLARSGTYFGKTIEVMWYPVNYIKDSNIARSGNISVAYAKIGWKSGWADDEHDVDMLYLQYLDYVKNDPVPRDIVWISDSEPLYTVVPDLTTGELKPGIVRFIDGTMPLRPRDTLTIINTESAPSDPNLAILMSNSMDRNNIHSFPRREDIYSGRLSYGSIDSRDKQNAANEARSYGEEVIARSIELDKK